MKSAPSGGCYETPLRPVLLTALAASVAAAEFPRPPSAADASRARWRSRWGSCAGLDAGSGPPAFDAIGRVRTDLVRTRPIDVPDETPLIYADAAERGRGFSAPDVEYRRPPPSGIPTTEVNATLNAL